MQMKLFAAVAGAFALAWTGTATAAVVVGDSSSNSLGYAIHNNDQDAAAASLQFHNILPGPNDLVVQYASGFEGGAGSIEQNSDHSAGYAWIGGMFDEVTITPYEGFDAFTSFKFNFESPKGQDFGVPQGGFKAPYTLSIQLSFLDGSPDQTIVLNDAQYNGGKLRIDAAVGEYITAIRIFDFGASKSGSNGDGFYQAPQPFGAIKQASFGAYTLTSTAPEPSSWALMIIGFGGVGAIIRRRRTDIALA